MLDDDIIIGVAFGGIITIAHLLLGYMPFF
jgi:hypothetical protein